MAKIQGIPFSYWSELRHLERPGEILDFVKRHRDLEAALRVQLRDSASRIIDMGNIKNPRETMFVDGILKSSIHRAAGSAKASLAPWSVSVNGMTLIPIGRHGTVSFEEGSGLYSVPSRWSIEIDRESFRRLASATELIFNNLDPHGRKYCMRVDFVMEWIGGHTNWWIIDIGESNLGFIMASQLHSAAGTGLDAAGVYANMVRNSMSGIGTVMIAYQDEKMLEGMPFEFEGMKTRLESYGIHVNVLPKSEFLALIAQDPGIARSSIALRFFRKANAQELDMLHKAEKMGFA